MSDYYPSGVTHKHFADDVDNHSTFTLTIDDVLSKGPINVEGMEFDTHATADLYKEGEYGDIEINNLLIRTLSIVVYDINNLPQTFILDKATLNPNMFKKIEDAISNQAKRLAKNSLKWEAQEI